VIWKDGFLVIQVMERLDSNAAKIGVVSLSLLVTGAFYGQTIPHPPFQPLFANLSSQAMNNLLALSMLSGLP